MDDDQITGFRRALNVIGVASAVFGGGWLAVPALTTAAVSTGVTFAMDAIEWECEAEEALFQACSTGDDAPAMEAPAPSQQPDQAHGKQWAASVAARPKAARRR
jgi:hypothetical protein